VYKSIIAAFIILAVISIAGIVSVLTGHGNTLNLFAFLAMLVFSIASISPIWFCHKLEKYREVGDHAAAERLKKEYFE
jgi:UPF0716 family protein affecting phage T7 exclusion